MKKVRPWLYLLLFLSAFWIASFMRETKPEFYGRYSFVASVLNISAIAVLSVVVLWKWLTGKSEPNAGGFGAAGLPLPRSWKRWMYDERPEKKQ